MSEQWRILPSNAIYEVSDQGQVRSRDHEVWGGPRVGFYTKPGRLLKPGLSSNGYPTVALGKGNSRTLHSLVAETFLGPRPEGKEVRHRDGDRKNPRRNNLEYGTRAENMQDARKHGTFKPEDAIRIAKTVATRDARDPDWRTKQFAGSDKIANARKAVETKDKRYGRKNWHSAQLAGVAYSKKVPVA